MLESVWPPSLMLHPPPRGMFTSQVLIPLAIISPPPSLSGAGDARNEGSGGAGCGKAE